MNIALEKTIVYQVAIFILAVVVGYLVIGSAFQSLHLTIIMTILASIIYFALEEISAKYRNDN